MPFESYSRYYDLLYRDKDYAAEVAYIDALLSRHSVASHDLLEFGSGTGKHGRLLAERGYRVTGVERSPTMVAQARLTEGFTCLQGDICAVQLGRTFGTVLSLFHVISYQVSNESVQSVFDRAAEHLESGGLFVFDVWHSPAVYAQRPEVRIKRLAEDNLEITRIAEPAIYPNENRVDVHYTIFAHDKRTRITERIDETHQMRHFSLLELDLLAHGAGFQRIAAEAFLTGLPPSEDTWGVCVVLRKR